MLRQGRMSPAQQRALDTLLPRYGLPCAGRAARLRPRVRPQRAARPRNRLRHGRDHRGDRAGASRATISSASRCTVPASAPAEAHRRPRPHQRARRPARRRRRRRDDDSPARSPAFTCSSPTRGRRSAITSAACSSRAFVHALARRLAPGGYLHVATDWEDYAQEILATLAAEPLLANIAPGFCAAPGVPPADQVRGARPQARTRRVGSRFPQTRRRLTSALGYPGCARQCRPCVGDTPVPPTSGSAAPRDPRRVARMPALARSRHRKRVADRLEIPVAVALVGLEVGAFGPLVPRIEEDHVLGRGPLRRDLDELPEPVLEALGRRVLEDPRALLVARGVVPIDERARKRGDAAFALDLEDLLPHQS